MLAVVFLGTVAAVTAAAAPNRLAVIQPAPDFSLTDQAGATVRLADLKGKVLLVSFVFTTCSGTCPATTHRMAGVEQALKAKGLLDGDRVRLLSITLDPVRDTPEVLRGYMRLYDIDPTHWTFLTGKPDPVRQVIAAWGMWARPAANGQLDHPSRIYLVDAQGRVREIYSLDFFRVPWVVEDVRLLVGEGVP